MANVMVVVDGNYMKTPDGDVYAQGVYGYSFFKRYLSTFDKVSVLARVKKVTSLSESCKKASGDRVSFLDLPVYSGPIQYMFKRHKILEAMKTLYSGCDCAVLRVPSATAQGIFSLIAKKMPVALEVVADPWECFAPNTLKKWYRPIIRVIWTLQLKKICKKANGVSYVTQKYLQKRYPCKANSSNKKDYFSSSYSSVEIDDGSLASPRSYANRAGTFHCVHAAVSFSGEGKGHKVVMKAINEVVKHGYDVDVSFIGDGPMKAEFENLAMTLGISDNVHFLGRLPGVEAVRSAMRNADLFVFPTRAEGLPRVLIEAMSEGLPCISTPICGIPEILSQEWMCNYDDFMKLANMIIFAINNPDSLTKQSELNLKTAEQFTNSKLSPTRTYYYSKLLSLVESEGRV